MFTVKFFAFTEGDSSHKTTQTSIQCPHYEVLTHESGWTIITYPGMTAEHGVERHITKDDQRVGRYDICFVENASGKTVDKFDMGGHPSTRVR